MSEKDFFDKKSEQSEIKTGIVHEFFWIWAHIISNHLKKQGNYKIGYVDLFAGRGRYKEDNSKSTPLIILETAIQNSEFSQTLATFFNDKKTENYEVLKSEIRGLLDIDILKYQPVVENFEVDDRTVDWIVRNINFPTLFFLDPCGYKGLSLNLIQHILKGFGCDCIFFFNYNRINQHLENPVMDGNMNSFFGRTRAEKLRLELVGKSKEDRQDLIIVALKDALVEHGGTYSIDYCFTKNDGNRTSHFLIYTTKHPAGFKKMAEVMGRKSSGKTEGVPSFSFNPKEKDKENAPTLFQLQHSPIDKLTESLINDFAGQSLTMRQIYYRHGLNDKENKYVLDNYKDALRKLEEQGKIITNPIASERQKRDGIITFGQNVLVTFPEKQN